MSDARRLAVLLTQRGARDPVPLAKALAGARKTPIQDQMVAARNAWGIVAQELGEDEARALVQALRSAGLESIACPTSALPELPTAEPATTLGALPTAGAVLIAVAGLTISTETKTTEKRGPTGAQKVLSTAISLGTGLPIKIGGRSRTVETTREEKSLAFYADLVFEGPFRRLRIAASRFDFSCLKERKLYQAQGNLKLLIGDLTRAWPEAWQNHGTQVLLQGKPIQTMGYSSLADLEKEERWLLALRALQRG